MRLKNSAALSIAFGALALAACEDVDSTLTVLGAAASEEDNVCVFDPEGEDYLLDIHFDAARNDSLALALRVQNNLQGGLIDLGGNAVGEDNLTIPAAVTPIRMDFRFECDTNGFSDELGALFVPQFSTDKPFCLQKDAREFQGFDVVQASGKAISPNNEIGIAFVRPITVQLARAFGEVFLLAGLAEDCCQSIPGGCTEDNLRNVPTTGNDACGELQDVFETIAPSKLSVNEIDDVQKFRPYSLFDWSNAVPPGRPPATIGVSYPMRLRGVLEGVTGDGSIVSSTEYYETVNICANCISTPCTNL